MDPLSFTASLLTMIGATEVIGKGLKRIIALRNAPDILLALNNEVADIYCVVQAVDHLIRQHPDTTHAVAIGNLCRALEKTQSTLFKLEDLVQEDLTVVKSRDGERKLDRLQWLRAASKVHKLKDQLRADRSDLTAALSLLASSASLGIDIQLRQLTFTVQTLGEQVDLAGEALTEQLQRFARVQKHSLDLNHGECNEGHRGKQATDQQSLLVGYTSRSSPTSLTRLAKGSPVEANNRKPQRAIIKAQSLPINLGVKKSCCSLDCSCACHRRNRLRSPNILNTVLGTLFVGYQTSPWFNSQNCDKAFCQSRSTKIAYAFPPWFLRRTLCVTMGFGHPQGLQFSARMMRVRPDDADIFTAVFRGAYNHVERLLQDGSGSVLDIDTRGNTALHWALRKMHLDAIELLVREGSDLFFEDSSGAFPYFIAWEKILGEPSNWTEDELDLLKDLFSEQSHLDSFHFSDLHRAYLGLSGNVFEEVLSDKNKSAIDLVDVSGRTTLSWAAQRGDVTAVEQLLKRGANVSKPDVSGRTSLHWSVYANSSECMRVLLLNNAEVDAKDDHGRTVLSSVASKKEDPSFVETLFDFKAELETEDGEGWRPLHWAAHKDKAVPLSQLLEKGADINIVDRRHRSALHLAVLRNCHKAIRVLVEKEAYGTTGRSEMGSTVLHVAARYGDIETLNLLTSADLSHIKVTEVNNWGFTAPSDAKWRRDKNEEWADRSLQPRDADPSEWYAAFEALVANILKAQGRIIGEENSDDGSAGKMLFDNDPSGRIDVTEGDDEEIWEDAHESTDGSSEPDTPARARCMVDAPYCMRRSTSRGRRPPGLRFASRRVGEAVSLSD